MAKTAKRSRPKGPTPPGADPLLDRLRAIVAKLPDVAETWPWGSCHWRIGGEKGRIFAGYSGGKVGFGVPDEIRGGLLADPRVNADPWGGLQYDLAAGKVDWKQIAGLLAMSRELVAAKAARPRRRGRAR